MKDDFTFGEWLDEWYEVYKKPRLTKAGQEPIERVIKLHVSPELKAIPLSSVKVFNIDKEISKLKPSRTQKYLHDIIVSALSKAYKVELVDKDLSKLVEPVKYKVKNGSALSDNEIMDLLEKFQGHKLEKLIRFYMLTGCRRHEALTLTRSDVDRVRQRVLLKGTKTAGSYRFIPLTDELDELLKTIEDNNDRYFPFNDDYVTKSFHKLCPGHKLHDLRHTFATICAESNIHPTATQKLLGHSQIGTTMKIYTHVQGAFVAQELKKFNFKKLKK